MFIGIAIYAYTLLFFKVATVKTYVQNKESDKQNKSYGDLK